MFKILLFLFLPVLSYSMPIDRQAAGDLRPIKPLDWTKAKTWEKEHSTKCEHIGTFTEKDVSYEEFYCVDGHKIINFI